MKSYIKNLLVLVMFVAIYGAIGLVPKKYMERETKKFLHQHPQMLDQIPVRADNAARHLLSGPPEAQLFVKSYMESYKKILWGTGASQWVCIALFGWVFSRANKNAHSARHDL